MAYEPSMHAAANTEGVIWQADDIGAVAVQVAIGHSSFDVSQCNILPSYPAENSVVCNGK